MPFIAIILGFGSLLYFISGVEINLEMTEEGLVAGSNLIVLEGNKMYEAEIGGEAGQGSSINSGVPDIQPQKPLSNPPAVIKAIYATGWSAGSQAKIQYFIDLINSTELNAIVIDIKDFSGAVLYDIQDEDVMRYGAKQVRIPRINTLIKKLHDDGIYVIARQTIFQDPILAKARPDLAIQKDIVTSAVIAATTTGRVAWLDSKGLGWVDAGAKEVWDYNIAIARDAASRGFDEINFDYIRFPSDGTIESMRFNHYDPKTISKQTQIRDFFKYLRAEMKGVKISADLFGLATVDNGDLGIGQNLEDAALYFDTLAPMTYPSHYAAGFIGYKNPGVYPYEVVQYSMERAIARLLKKECAADTIETVTSSTTITTEPITSCQLSVVGNTRLRPWLQDFDLGADYDAEKVRMQIRAVDEVVKETALYNGWMLWAPSNVYTKAALDIQ